MSSRFVSGGTLPGDTTETPAPASAAPTQPQQPTPSSSTSANASTKPASSNPTPSSSTTSNKNAAEWARVQAELEASRAQREATRRANAEGTSGEEKSLFEVLQANKAAKQAAFEEASRLSNQFRALDDDEVDFLEEVQEKERQEEERKRRELEEGLGKFRQAQNKGRPPANGAGKNDVVEEEEEEVVPTEDLASEWAGAATGGAGRKRKREKEVLFKGIKRKSTSESAQEKSIANKSADAKGTTKTAQAANTSPAPKAEQTTKPPAAASRTVPKPMLGLVAYGSDDDDDD
ncbi:hypothetical protein PG996_012559 [Apiospora saccharicola]|uniref:FAM192A/Fyv6 N-terminal domain-containing protein n=1 Tax=Apiospora saccharicola TaxID=335842 RepID=A0ABR1U354_9PEZI